MINEDLVIQILQIFPHKYILIWKYLAIFIWANIFRYSFGRYLSCRIYLSIHSIQKHSTNRKPQNNSFNNVHVFFIRILPFFWIVIDKEDIFRDVYQAFWADVFPQSNMTKKILTSHLHESSVDGNIEF